MIIPQRPISRTTNSPTAQAISPVPYVSEFLMFSDDHFAPFFHVNVLQTVLSN